MQFFSALKPVVVVYVLGRFTAKITRELKLMQTFVLGRKHQTTLILVGWNTALSGDVENGHR